jgi:hypothetical protein
VVLVLVLVLVLVPASTADAATATIVVIVRSTARRVGDTGAWVMSGKPCSERGEEGQADAQQRNASLAATLVSRDSPKFTYDGIWCLMSAWSWKRMTGKSCGR